MAPVVNSAGSTFEAGRRSGSAGRLRASCGPQSLLYALALAVRAVLVALYPDPAYPDSYYYVDVARAIAAGNGLNVDFVWIFAEVGNRLPDPAVLPIPSNAHWLPLASFLQAPFVSVLGPTALATRCRGSSIGVAGAPLTWLIARDAGAAPARRHGRRRPVRDPGRGHGVHGPAGELRASSTRSSRRRCG